MTPDGPKGRIVIEVERDSRTLVARCFSKSPESWRLRNPRWFFWRTSRVCSPTTEEELFTESSPFSGNLVMWDRQKCLTLRTSESRRTGRGLCFEHLRVDASLSEYEDVTRNYNPCPCEKFREEASP